MPIMDSYQGLIDPIVHLQRYAQHMLTSKATEEVVCKCFPFFLSDLTIMWFCRLRHCMPYHGKC